MKFSYSLLKKIYPATPSLQKVAELLPLHTFEVEGVEGDMIDIKVLPNRYSDAASHVGIAREIAAITGKPFTAPIPKALTATKNPKLLKVAIQDKKVCSRYSSTYFEIKKPFGKSSPAIQQILRTCGINPINAIVDITNYTMLVTGQPLHIFDADKLSKTKKGVHELVLRLGEPGEIVTTLDNKEVAVSGIPVIADSDKPLDVAGIKGGRVAEVTNTTQRFVLEAACFDGATILKASRATRVISDASTRFSHGLSQASVEWAVAYAAKLYAQLGAKCIEHVEVRVHTEKEKHIVFDPAAFAAFIGMNVQAQEAKAIFKRLDFKEVSVPAKLKKSSPAFTVVVPSWRSDIENAHDLYEEVVRIAGVSRVPSVAPAIALANPISDDVVQLQGQVKQCLARLGIDEIYTSSFVSEAQAQYAKEKNPFGVPVEPIELANPISSEKQYLRATLVPNIAAATVANARFYDRCRVFEVGHVVGRVGTKSDEAIALAIALYDKKQSAMVREVKGVIESMFYELGIGEYAVSRDGVITIGAQYVGSIAHIHPETNIPLTVCEMNLSALLAEVSQERAFTPLAKFPSVVRDISLLVRKEYGIGEIADAIYALAKQRHLVDVDLIDEYVDEVKFNGSQSLTFRLVFCAPNKSLTDAEVNETCAAIQMQIARDFSAQVR